ncbi:MATE family efflux transporter [Clostridium sp. 'deep sea']|uniref:MATE family efflux transporter n=1 Tax=Clostridium sp. 'deep sea' TaxID=2779445 RepID=UPI001A9BD2A2|nr:MATE family efflux transporter [Clostridium sp. 'deep sea']
MQEKRAEMLGKDKISRVLIKLAIPAIIGMLVSAIYNVVDTLFVSSLGTEALGAVTVVFPFFMLVSAIGMMFGSGSASYISRLLGQKNTKRANQTVIVTLVSSIACSIIFTCLGLVFLEPVLAMFGASKTIMPFARDYAVIIICGSIFTMSNMALNNMLRAEGSAKISMIGMVSGAVLNIALDPILIFMFNMGVRGAALATVISQAVTTVILLYYYLSKKSYLKLSLGNFTFSREIYSEIFKIGIPTLLRQGLASLSMGMMNSAAVVYGDAAVAAVGVTNRVIMVAFYVLFGFSQGFQPLAGYNFGAKKYDRVQKTVKIAVQWSTIYCLIISGLIFIAAPAIVSAFSNKPEVINTGVKMLRYYSVVLPTFGFTIMYNTLFMAFGRAKSALILSTARQGIFLIPAIIILPKIFNLEGVLMSQPVAAALSFCLTAYMASRIQKELKELVNSQNNEKQLQLSPVNA